MNEHEIADLHARLVDGTLDAAGRQQFAGLLEEASARGTLARLMRVDGLLVEELRPAKAVSSRWARPARSTRTVRNRGPRIRPSIWLPTLMAVAALIAVWILVVPPSTPHQPQQPQVVAPSEPPSPQPVSPSLEPMQAWRVLADGREIPWDGGTADVAQLRWADGTRLRVAPGARWSVADGDRSVRLDAGEFTLSGEGRDASPAAPRISGPGGRYVAEKSTVTLNVEDGATTARIGEGGRLLILASNGEQSATLNSDSAWKIAADGRVWPVPSLAWRAVLPAATQQPGTVWYGNPVADGLVFRYDRKTSVETNVDTFNITVETPSIMGLAKYDPEARLVVDLTVPGKRLVGINIHMWSADGRWLAAVEQKLPLPAGRQRLDLRIGDLPVIEGDGSNLNQSVIRRIAVMGWSPNAVLHSLEIAPASDTPPLER